MDSTIQTILKEFPAGRIYGLLRVWLSKNKILIARFKKEIDLTISVLHRKVNPIIVADINTEFLEGKITLDEAIEKLNFFEEYFKIDCRRL